MTWNFCCLNINYDVAAKSNITDCSRNPAKHSEFMGPLPHFFLMLGVSQVLIPTCRQACVGNGLLTRISNYKTGPVRTGVIKNEQETLFRYQSEDV